MIYETLSSEYVFQFEASVKASLKNTWKYVSDTERANQFLGQPVMEYKDFPLPKGGSKKEGLQTNTGFTFRFEEQPSEWVEEKFYQIVRDCKFGFNLAKGFKLNNLSQADGSIGKR